MNASGSRLLAGLKRRGGWPGPVEHRVQVDSTNSELRRQSRRGLPLWSVLLAGTQTGGRGRHGRRWHSPLGNLHVSVLLPPPSRPECAGLVPLLGGLAVAESLAAAGVESQLKWPNDVLSPAGRKLAGVLAEATSGPAGIESIVLGFGVNLVADTAALPEEVRDTIGVARDAAGRAPDAAELAAALLGSLRRMLAELDAGADEELRRRWRSRAVDWWGAAVEVTSGGERLHGVARELDPGGALVLELADGSRCAVTSGDARQLRPGRR